MTRTWKDVWAARRLDPARATVLDRLMAADGLDTGFGDVSEAAWRAFSLRTGDRLGAGPGTRLFEIGCGAGAFLFPLVSRGCVVGGVDQSAALIQFAREAMPDGRWMVGDAAGFAAGADDERWDAVVACGVFMYFPDLAYAREVVARMVRMAGATVAILDVPDLARRDAALAFRRGTLGEAEYEAKYRGLDHLFYDRAWLRETLLGLGASAVEIEDQQVDGYRNAAFRFNAFARIPPAGSRA